MKSRPVGRPRDGDPERTRREILRAAEAAFARSGFAGATTRQLAEDAGVNVGTVHYHFGSKEGLYRAVLLSATRDEPRPLPEDGSPSQRVARVVSDVYDFSARRPHLARLSALDLLAGPPARGKGQSQTSRDERQARIAATLESPAVAAEASLPSGHSPADVARWIVALIDASLLASTPREPAKAGVVAASLRLAGLDGN